jgi:hypothetical protein
VEQINIHNRRRRRLSRVTSRPDDRRFSIAPRIAPVATPGPGLGSSGTRI